MEPSTHEASEIIILRKVHTRAHGANTPVYLSEGINLFHDIFIVLNLLTKTSHLIS